MNYDILLKIFFTISITGIMGLLFHEFSKDALATLDISGSQSTATTTTNYTTYTSTKYGITFEYPADWDLTEKTNRFDSGPDVEVDDGFNSFKFLDKDDRLNVEDNIFIDLEFVTTTLQNSLVDGSKGDRLIESVSLDEYRIDGHETGSFLYVHDPTSEWSVPIGFEVASLMLAVDNDGDVYTMSYSDNVRDFDTPQGEEIRNHILNSFHFLDSDSNDINDEDNNDDNDDDEDN
ncbi:MAG: PsbP-related protein [Candidatus Nitrosocosmicus sp.]